MKRSIFFSYASPPASLIFISVAAMLFTAGCSERYQIEVSDLSSGSPLFDFKKNVLAPPTGVSTVTVNKIVVAESLGGNRTSPVWHIESDKEEGIDMKEARYGVVPAGFSEKIKPQTLMPNKEYVIVVSGPAQFGVKSFSMPWKQ